MFVSIVEIKNEEQFTAQADSFIEALKKAEQLAENLRSEYPIKSIDILERTEEFIYEGEDKFVVLKPVASLKVVK